MIFSDSASKEVIYLCIRVRLSHLLEHGLDVCGTGIFNLTTEIGMNRSVAAGALQSACRKGGRTNARVFMRFYLRREIT